MPRRVKATLLAAALAAGAVLPATATAAAPAAVPAAVPLTSGWQYKPDPQATGTSVGLAQWEATPGWGAITLPHVFDARPLASEFGGTVGWYKIAFTAPAARRGFGWAFNFQQVRRTMTAWLNGRQIGTNADPYIPFRLPASGIKAGQRNMLVIRVDNRKGVEPREGWWNWGGITRGVTLVPRGQLALESPGLLSAVKCPQDDPQAVCKAAFRFDGTVVNRSSKSHSDANVRVTLTPPGGGPQIVTTKAAPTLAPSASARVTFDIPVPAPALWSPDAPKLYAATITTSAASTPTQVDRMRPGLREVSVRDGILELNGRPVALHGAAVLEDMKGHGAAITDADIKTIVSELKAVHANITRAHYLLNPRLLDALDAAGIMVWSQAPIYHRDRTLVTTAQRSAALATLRGTILSARSHPAVITHSVANELSVIPDTVPGTKAYLDDAYTTAKDLDPTLPISVDLLSYPGYGHQNTYAQFDMLGINSYFGWYPGKANHSTGKLADLGPYLDNMRRMYPGKALVVTEFGAESTFNGPAREKETYAFQSDYVRSIVDIVAQRPFVAGEIYWTLREFAVKPKWDGGANRHVPRDSIHNKGLIRYDGQPKPAFAVAAKAFAAVPLFRPPPGAGGKGPSGRSPDDIPVAILAALGVLLLLLVDGWAVKGILRARRAERQEPDEAATAHAG